MTKLSTVIGIDLTVVSACAFALLLWGNVRLSHPGVLYVVFHVAVFSLRAIAVSKGAVTYFDATEAECAKALAMADVALVCATLGWLVAARRSETATPPQPVEARELRMQVIIPVALIAFPYGVYSMLKFTNLPGSIPSDSFATNTYETFSVTWPGLVLTILIYRLGFRVWLLTPMAVYLVIMSLQGQSRFRVVLPLILLTLIYLDRKKRRWPRLPVTAALIAAFLLFFPLKTIGHDLQAGIPPGKIAARVGDSFFTPFRGDSEGQAILDQLALSVSLADQRQRVFWGRPYLNVLVLPVPRRIWPEKPGLAEHIKELQTRSQRIGTSGAVTTMVGDFYLNFRWFGVVFLSFFLAYLSGRLFTHAYRRPYSSVARFMWLVIAASSIQIARDGLISIPVFLLIQGFPYSFIAVVHLLGPQRRELDDTESPPVNSAYGSDHDSSSRHQRLVDHQRAGTGSFFR